MTDLTRALRLHLSRDNSAFPSENRDAVINAFGPERGSELNSEIDALVSEIDSLEVDWEQQSLQSATDWVEAEFRRRHPELEPEAIATLGWAFSYWNK